MTQNNPDPRHGFFPLHSAPQDPCKESEGGPAETSTTAKYYLDLGNRHYYSYLTRSLKRDLETAIRHYRRALEVEPGLSQAYVKLASALWEKGEINLDNAMNYCQLALTYNPDNTEANLFLGYCLKKSGRLDDAMTQFRLALAFRPLQSSKARIALGTTLINKATYLKRLPMVQRVGLTLCGLLQFSLGLLLLPLDRETFSQILQALWTDVSIQSVLLSGSLLRLLALKGLSARLYEWAAGRRPSEPLFFHLLGDCCSESQNPDAAVYHYNRALELDPENTSLHRKLAKAYRQCLDLANAAKSLEKVVVADERDFESRYDLAQIYTEQGEFIRALYYFREAMGRKPQNPYVHSNMAYVLFKLEDYEGAIEHYRQAIGHGEDPLWTSTIAQTLGTLYYQVNHDVAAATSAFTLAHELDPGNADCMIMLAELYFEQGNLQGALDIYRVIVACDPQNPDCHNYMGYLLWQLDRNDEAMGCYHEALRYDPENYIAYNNLGVIFLDEQLNAEEAGKMFARALQIKPDYTLAAFNLGRSQEMLGRIPEAAKQYSQALELNALNPELATDEIRERIETLFKL